MNYGKRSTSKKRNALISRTSMLEKKSTCFVYPGFIYSSDRSLRPSLSALVSAPSGA